MCLGAPAKAFVSGNPSQFDQCLTFEWCSLTIRAVVPFEFIKRNRPHAGIPIRPEPQVNVKNSFCASLDEIDSVPCQGFEKRGAAPIVMNEYQLQVGGIAHFSAAELTKPTDRKRAVFASKSSEANSGGLIDDHFGQVCDRIGKLG